MALGIWALRDGLASDGPEACHVSTIDVDLGFDAEVLGYGEYASLIESLQEQGYQQRRILRHFQLARHIQPAEGDPAIEVIVDFLMPHDAQIVKNKPASSPRRPPPSRGSGSRMRSARSMRG